LKNIEVSASMLEQAYSRLKTARMALKDRNYAYTIRSSQECVELSLKAALRLMAIEYPKKHDVSRILLMNRERFPEWFPTMEFAKMSRMLAEKREPAMYGDELRKIPASVLFDETEAREALRIARRVHSFCLKLHKEARRQ